jgi:hypothetical protein
MTNETRLPFSFLSSSSLVRAGPDAETRRGNPRRGSPRDLEIYEEQARGKATGGVLLPPAWERERAEGGEGPLPPLWALHHCSRRKICQREERGHRCVHHGPVPSLLPWNLQREVGGRGETVALVLLTGAAGGEGEAAEGGARDAGVSAGLFRMTAGEENGRSSGWARRGEGGAEPPRMRSGGWVWVSTQISGPCKSTFFSELLYLAMRLK